MAIQFPPINVGDPEPQDGDSYLYVPTQSEFICFRNEGEAARWSEEGVISDTTFGYRGGLNIQDVAPTDAVKGNIYSVLDGGEANISFTGLAGTDVSQYTLIIFDDPNWYPLSADSGDAVQGPWIRTAGGRIQPAIDTDDLDMLNGDYLINELDYLP